MAKLLFLLSILLCLAGCASSKKLMKNCDPIKSEEGNHYLCEDV